MVPFWNPFGHHQDYQECQECPKNGFLEDFGCINDDFVIVTPHDTFLESLGLYE